MCDLPKLETLVLRGNRLSDLPTSNWQKLTLKELDLSDNPLLAGMPENWDVGTMALAADKALFGALGERMPADKRDAVAQAGVEEAERARRHEADAIAGIVGGVVHAEAALMAQAAGAAGQAAAEAAVEAAVEEAFAEAAAAEAGAGRGTGEQTESVADAAIEAQAEAGEVEAQASESEPEPEPESAPEPVDPQALAQAIVSEEIDSELAEVLNAGGVLDAAVADAEAQVLAALYAADEAALRALARAVLEAAAEEVRRELAEEVIVGAAAEAEAPEDAGSPVLAAEIAEASAEFVDDRAVALAAQAVAAAEAGDDEAALNAAHEAAAAEEAALLAEMVAEANRADEAEAAAAAEQAAREAAAAAEQAAAEQAAQAAELQAAQNPEADAAGGGSHAMRGDSGSSVGEHQPGFAQADAALEDSLGAETEQPMDAVAEVIGLHAAAQVAEAAMPGLGEQPADWTGGGSHAAPFAQPVWTGGSPAAAGQAPSIEQPEQPEQPEPFELPAPPEPHTPHTDIAAHAVTEQFTVPAEADEDTIVQEPEAEAQYVEPLSAEDRRARADRRAAAVAGELIVPPRRESDDGTAQREAEELAAAAHVEPSDVLAARATAEQDAELQAMARSMGFAEGETFVLRGPDGAMLGEGVVRAEADIVVETAGGPVQFDGVTAVAESGDVLVVETREGERLLNTGTGDVVVVEEPVPVIEEPVVVFQPVPDQPTVVYDGPAAVVDEEVVDVVEGPDSFAPQPVRPGGFEERTWQPGGSDADRTHVGTPPGYGPPPAPSQPWRSSS